MHICILYTGESSSAGVAFNPQIHYISVLPYTHTFHKEMLKAISSCDVLIFEISEDKHCLERINSVTKIRKYVSTPFVTIFPRETTQSVRETFFRNGIDSCVHVPYHPEELSIRVQKLFTKSKALFVSGPVFTHGDISIDIVAHVVYRNGSAIKLTSSEYRILLHLVFNQHTVTTGVELSARCGVSLGSVSAHIRSIRHKCNNYDTIRTVSHYGYILEHRAQIFENKHFS